MAPPHFLLTAFPSPSHINPALQLALHLIRAGALVTFAISASAYQRMMCNFRSPEGLTFATFSDTFSNAAEVGSEPKGDLECQMAKTVELSSNALRELLEAGRSEGRQFTCIIYTAAAPWVANLARSYNISSFVLWIQPATLFNIYYYYFNGYRKDIENAINDPSSSARLPCLPPLRGCDIPSLLSPGNPFGFLVSIMQKQYEALKEENKPSMLVNTIDALESDELRAIDEIKLVPIGPLIPSLFSLDGRGSSDKPLVGNLLDASSRDYFKWLDTKPGKSVIYVSFGSISVLSKLQKEEIARALLRAGRPFLWVIRKDGEGKQEEDRLSCQEELEQKGIIVPWCTQAEVLSHPSVGCFVTHCGWNSTLEGLVCGVPMVAFPQWTDQQTNAVLIEQVWKVGVRVRSNEEGIVGGDEIEKCLERVMGGGESSEEMRRNAKSWKDLAREACSEGGSSDLNIKAFLREVIGAHHQ